MYKPENNYYESRFDDGCANGIPRVRVPGLPGEWLASSMMIASYTGYPHNIAYYGANRPEWMTDEMFGQLIDQANEARRSTDINEARQMADYENIARLALPAAQLAMDQARTELYAFFEEHGHPSDFYPQDGRILRSYQDTLDANEAYRKNLGEELANTANALNERAFTTEEYVVELVSAMRQRADQAEGDYSKYDPTRRIDRTAEVQAADRKRFNV